MRHSQLFTMSSYTYWAGLILEIPLKKCGLFLGVAMVWWKFHTGQFPVHLPFPCEASIILSRVLGTSFDIRGREPECKPPSTSPTLELVPKSMLLGNLSDTC